MEITPEIYTKVLKRSKYHARRQSAHHNEDLAQSVFEKLIKYEGEVENLNAFINQVTLFTNVTGINREKVKGTNMENYAALANRLKGQLEPCQLISRDFLTQCKVLLGDSSVQYNVLLALLEHDDKTYKQIAELMGQNYETFKSNVRHVQKKIKNTPLYKGLS